LASIDASTSLCPIGLIHLSVTRMLIKVPGQDFNVRLFERVKAVDDQYDLFDVGIERPGKDEDHPIIDSVCVGGSFAYAKSLVKTIDEKAEAKKATAPVVAVAPPAAAA